MEAEMVQITYPWLLLLVIAPYLVYYLWPMKVPSKKPLRMPSVPLVMARRPQSSVITIALCAAAFVSLVFACSRPVYLSNPLPVVRENYNIVIAVDLSISMQTKDIKQGNVYVSRLDAAKREIKKFIKKRNGDSFALVVFGEKAFIMSPLTTDISLLSDFVDELDVNLAGSLTSLGDAILLSAQAADAGKSEHKVMIVMTDGKDTLQKISTDDAITFALDHQMTVYTVGVGAYTGKATGTELDIPTLKNIAEETGGQFYRATDSAAMERIYDNINAKERKKANEQIFQPIKELYPIPLFLALAFAVAAAIRIRGRHD